MPFYKSVQKTFRVTKLDYFVTIVAFIVFIYAFFFASFQPVKDADGNITYYMEPDGSMKPVTDINVQVFIAPLILIYEMFQLTILPGKTRLRYLPWGIWFGDLLYYIKKRLREGLKEYREWRS